MRLGRLVRLAGGTTEALAASTASQKATPQKVDFIQGMWLTMEELLPTLPLSSYAVLAEKGIETPSPIQAVAIPLICEGNSVVLFSETGSGKTMAYMLPAMERARLADEDDGSVAVGSTDSNAVVLVLAPTRELVVQIMGEGQDHCHGGIAMVAPAAKPPWGKLLNATLIVATPIELLEIFDKQDAEEVKYLLGRVQVCVLDEFDEMLPKRKFEGETLHRYQDPGMWPAEGVIKRLLRNNERKSLQVIAASATAYRPNRVKLWKVLRTDKLRRFPQPLRILRPAVIRTSPEDQEVAGQSSTESSSQVIVFEDDEIDALEDAEEYDDDDKNDDDPLDFGSSAEFKDDSAEQEEEDEQMLLEPQSDTDTHKAIVAQATEEKPADKRRPHPTLPQGIKHYYWKTPVHGTHSKALSIAMDKLQPQSALVFTCPNAGESVRSVVEDLEKAGWSNVQSLTKALFPRQHKPSSEVDVEKQGWKSAGRLQAVSEATRQGYSEESYSYREAPVFVSSEDSARGLHLDAVEAVFVLGLPKNAASYMHMAGRTGRLPHPYGSAVLVAKGREIAKVVRGFRGSMDVRNWTMLGSGNREPRANRPRQDSSDSASSYPGRRSAVADALDAALGGRVQR